MKRISNKKEEILEVVMKLPRIRRRPSFEPEKHTVISPGTRYESFSKNGKRYRMPVEGQCLMKSANSFYKRESLKPHFLGDDD